MVSRKVAFGMGLALILTVAGVAEAQAPPPAAAPPPQQPGVEIESTAPPPPKFEIIKPEVPINEITRTPDADFYSTFGAPTLPYDPAFIAPFTKETETGRMGLAGWTSPFGVVTFEGVDNTRQPGFLSFGFAITWGGAPRKPGASPVSAPR
jgi:hypothetical protein